MKTYMDKLIESGFRMQDFNRGETNIKYEMDRHYYNHLWRDCREKIYSKPVDSKGFVLSGSPGELNMFMGFEIVISKILPPETCAIVINGTAVEWFKIEELTK